LTDPRPEVNRSRLVVRNERDACMLILPTAARTFCFQFRAIISAFSIGNECVPIQLAQCWFPGLAISSAKI